MDVLAYALEQCHADRVTGVLRIAGNAGGLFHFRDGVVVAVDSPGSPGADTLLLSSGRIGQDDWTGALVESVETRSLEAALVARGVIRSDEVQEVAAAALRDGVFAVAAGEIERHFVDEPVEHALLPVSDGVAPDVLLAETARRLDALPFDLSPYRDRVVVACGAELGGLSAARREIVEQATGRRSARDVAFALGCGLHPVTDEIARMLGDGLLEIAPPAMSFGFSHWGLTSLHPRRAAVLDSGIA